MAYSKERVVFSFSMPDEKYLLYPSSKSQWHTLRNELFFHSRKSIQIIFAHRSKKQVLSAKKAFCNISNSAAIPPNPPNPMCKILRLSRKHSVIFQIPLQFHQIRRTPCAKFYVCPAPLQKFLYSSFKRNTFLQSI